MEPQIKGGEAGGRLLRLGSIPQKCGQRNNWGCLLAGCEKSLLSRAHGNPSLRKRKGWASSAPVLRYPQGDMSEHEKLGGSASTTEDCVSPIQEEIERFQKTIDGLIATFPLTMWFVNSAWRGSREELHTFMTTKCKNVTTSGGTVTADVPPALIRDCTLMQRKVDHTSTAAKAISRSFVVSLISQYDSFLGTLIRALIGLRPELINSSDRVLTFKDLNAFSSISAARDFVVEKEVESLIRKSHTEQFDWLENRFSVKLRKGLDSWCTFVEATERRNLFVHCEGRVSSQYLDVCRQHDIDCSTRILGEELTVSQTYFSEVSETVLEIGVKLGHVLWRKLCPEQREDADGSLNQVCLDLISDRRYRLAVKVLDFATNTLKNWSSEAVRRIFVLNRAQAYKWSNDEQTCGKILAAEDWTAVEGKFALAKAVLINDFSQAVNIMKRIGKGSQIPQEAYKDWPVFREFRKTPEFRDCYRQVFGEEFSEAQEAPQVSYTFKWDVKPHLTGAPTGSKPN